jgi:hypothetical protein
MLQQSVAPAGFTYVLCCPVMSAAGLHVALWCRACKHATRFVVGSSRLFAAAAGFCLLLQDPRSHRSEDASQAVDAAGCSLIQRAATCSVWQPHWPLLTSAASTPLLVNAVGDKPQPDKYRYIHSKAQPGYKLYTVPRNSVSSTSSAIVHVCDASLIVSSCIMLPYATGQVATRDCHNHHGGDWLEVGLVGKKHSKPVAVPYYV